MIEANEGIPVDPEEARRWVERSLACGGQLSATVRHDLDRFEVASLLVPNGDFEEVPTRLDDQGRHIATARSDVLAAQFVLRLRGRGARTLIVENDLARRGDPWKDEQACFVQERVLVWMGFDDLASESGSDAIGLLRRSASGYPLNAFVSSVSPGTLGLEVGAELGLADLVTINASISCVMVSVFDAEAIVALERR